MALAFRDFFIVVFHWIFVVNFATRRVVERSIEKSVAAQEGSRRRVHSDTHRALFAAAKAMYPGLSDRDLLQVGIVQCPYCRGAAVMGINGIPNKCAQECAEEQR